MFLVAIVDGLLNNDALKNNKGENLSETWTKLVQDLKLFEDNEDYTNYLRNRWVSGSAEWMAGENGSKQNDKELFGYSDDEWQYIWSTMVEDGAWAVPSIMDSFGNVVKGNFAPEIMIKYIAHDLKCHIIVIDLLLDNVQFCSGNHVKDDNVVFDSPLIVYSTGGHFQSVFQIDHEFFISYAQKQEDLNKGTMPSSEPDGLPITSPEIVKNVVLAKASQIHNQKDKTIHPSAKSACESTPAPTDTNSSDNDDWVLVKQKPRKRKLIESIEIKQIVGMHKSDKNNLSSSLTVKSHGNYTEVNKYVREKKLKDMSDEERREYRRQKYKERMSKVQEADKVFIKKTWAINKESLRRKKREENPEIYKELVATKMANQRAKKRKENPEVYKELVANEKSSQRTKKRNSLEGRSKQFKDSIKAGRIYECICCHRLSFHNGVTSLDNAFITKIKKHSLILDAAIGIKSTTKINGKFQICTTCKNHISNGKMPPMSHKNSLELIDLSNYEELNLTELENSMVALNIIFQKVFNLPKSRWPAMKDKTINIPIYETDILNTIESLPRNPHDAGIIPVNFKRKLGYKNTHMAQYISVPKITEALKTLKKMGNKYYQFVPLASNFEDDCRDKDLEGFNFIFPEDEICKEDPKETKEDDQKEKESDENEIEKELEQYEKYDSVKKWQFQYNKSTCFSNNYPEISYKEDDTGRIAVAPGEGKCPSNILDEKDWDLKSFPCLLPDGESSLHSKRNVKLSDQEYFTQRIMNKDPRFACNPAYVFAAVAYIEKKQIESRRGISYMRGKATTSKSDGTTTYTLNDPCSVLDNIKNTPRYWQKARYELLARLENLGPFTFFFTLSCGDMRWPENFTALLKDQTVTYEEIDFKEEVKVNGMLLEDYLRENENKHAFIKKNLLNATLTFHHRVKMFVKYIIMSTGNPMSIKYNSYKVEFAMRGAAHIHGVLWVDWQKFIGLEATKTKCLADALERIKNEEIIDETHKKCIQEFADLFITCSLKDVETEDIVRDVQMHNHTMCCRKHGRSCRFFYPRFPSLKTIVAVPFDKCHGSNEEPAELLNKSKQILKKVSDVLEDDEVMDELMKIEIDEIERYKQVQRNKLNIKKIMNDIEKNKKVKIKKAIIGTIRDCINVEKENIKNEMEAIFSELDDRFDIECEDIRSDLKHATSALEKEENKDIVLKVGKSEIERYKQVQIIISKIQKTIFSFKNHEDQCNAETLLIEIKEYINTNKENWSFTQKNFETLYRASQDVFDLINIDEVEVRRLEALLEKAKIIPENGQSPIKIYESALGISAKGYKIVYKRDIDEIYVNNYNREWLINWNANMDLQLCLDYYAIITYICDYYSKDDSGTIGHIAKALKKAENESLKTKLSLVINQFLTHRQIGESEAYFKILPHLHMKWSNIETVFVPTGFKSNRSSFLKQLTKEEAKRCQNTIKVENKDGLFMEKPSMMDKFERKDVSKNPHISKMRYLQFCMKYTSTNCEPKDEDFNSIEYKVNEEGWDISDELDLIVTDDFNYQNIHYSLPKVIKLVNPRPGEPKYMRRRSRQVARFHKINKTKHPHEYYYSELQLYSEFRMESELEAENFEQCKVIYEQKSNNSDLSKIQSVKSILMNHLESVEEATETALEMVKSNIGDTLDSALEQDNDDCEQMGFTDNPDFVFKDPGEFVTQKEISKRYKEILLYDEEVLNSMTRKLDEDQRQVLDIGVNFAKNIVKARKAKGTVTKPPLMVIQGGAGSGKSTIIDVLSQHMEKVLRTPGDNPDNPYVIKAAFTGTAAANIRGQTLHNAFGFSFGNEFFSLGDKARDERRMELENLKIVIIDEFSLVKSDMLYQLDLRLKEVMQKPDWIFGGLSVFLLGDILQLKPVMARYIFEEPTSESFLIPYLLNSLWEMFNVIMLKTNHRQGEDKVYADLLNRIRIGNVTDEDLEILETRVRPINHPDLPLDALVISCTNVEVSRINRDRLAMINETEHVIEAVNFTRTQQQLKTRTDPSGAISGTPLQKTLRLKIGAKVMLTYNIDTCDCLTNGAFGEVKGYQFDQNGVIKQVHINFYDEECGKLRRKNFVALQQDFPGQNITPIELMEFQYSLSKKSSGTNSNATVIQFPLKLAFAATAHKVQGQTVKKPNSLVIDLRSVREAAQAYVILSRVQALNQLFILVAVCAHKITASVKAMEELKRMNRVAINRNLDLRFAVVSCNIRSATKHFKDFITASKVKEAKVLCIQESWLDPLAENEFEIPGWNQHNNSAGRGKGIITCFKSGFEFERDVTQSRYQMTKITSGSIDIINVYRSSDAETTSFLQDLCGLIDSWNHTLVLGDFNICYNSQSSHLLFSTLNSLGFRQLVKSATHKDGRLIDHVFFHCPDNNVYYEVQQQAQYYTDHDLIKVIQGKNE